jgi:hypothetical protein
MANFLRRDARFRQRCVWFPASLDATAHQRGQKLCVEAFALRTQGSEPPAASTRQKAVP